MVSDIDLRRNSGGIAALLALPAALGVYCAFHAGGYFAGTPALLAVVLSVALVLRVTLAERPFEGLGLLGLVAFAGFALYALWQLISANWSHAPGRALVESDRSLMYALAVLLMGSIRLEGTRLRGLLVLVTSGLVGVALISLTSRVLPQVWPTNVALVDNRLSYPLTYWNALGLVAAFGALGLLQLAADRSLRLPARALAAALLPAVVVTLYLTLSRGAILVLGIGVVVYVVAGVGRGLIAALLAAVPAAGIATAVAYRAHALTAADPRTPTAVHQGRGVALAVLLCAVLAMLILTVGGTLERRLPGGSPRRVAAGQGIAVTLILLVVGGLLATGALQSQYHGFVSGNTTPTGSSRLASAGNNGRIELWRVALRQFDSAPVRGRGTGTFETWWQRHRAEPAQVVQAHSLYLQAMGETGIVGLVLLVVALLSLLLGVARRLRGPDRPMAAVILASLTGLCLHAGIDWDWEMPAVMLPVLALAAGCATSGSDERRSDRRLPSLPRVLLGLVGLAVAVAPARLALAQSHLDSAVRDFGRGDCAGAVTAALGSARMASSRSEPYELLGFCDVRLGQRGLAIAALRAAVARDPENWDYHYGLALVQGATGSDPRPEARVAQSRNPQEPLASNLVRRLRGAEQAQWARITRAQPLPLPSQNLRAPSRR